MSERKLFFPGLGGNRYEISLEELQKQAYKGKVKRDDKIIVAKIKDGQTSEIETTCGKIRVVAESFDQGEADRKAEAERKLAEKQAKEAERLAREKEKEETRAREKAEAELSKTTNESAQKMQSLSANEAFLQAYEGCSFLTSVINGIITPIIWAHYVIILLLVFFCCYCLYVGSIEGIICGLIFIAFVVFSGWIYTTIQKIVKTIIWRPLQIAVYQVNSLKEPFVEATSGFKFPLVDSNKSDSSSNWDSNSDNSARQESTSETVSVPPREI